MQTGGGWAELAYVAAMTAPLHMPAPVPDRPLNSFDIADGAFAILRSRPRTVAAIAASFVLPVQLVSAFLNRELVGSFDFGDFDTNTGQFEGQGDFTNLVGFSSSTPITSTLQLLILPFLGVALTYLVLGWRGGRDHSAKDCLLFTLKKTHVIVAVFVVGKIVQVLTLFLATPVLMLLAPIVAAEGLGPLAAIRRSFSLGRRRYWPLVGLLILIFFVNLLLTYALFLLPVLGGFLLGSWGWVAFFALGSVGATVQTLLGTGVAVLAYIDVRNRTEGADLIENVRAARSRAG